MENSIKIRSNAIRIAVEKNDGSEHILTINPDDLVFVQNMYEFYAQAQKKEKEYKAQIVALNKDKTKDSLGLPANLDKIIDINMKYADYMRKKMDDLFGTGTCQELFGQARDFNAILHLIEDIMPFISKSRKTKMDKYLNEENETEEGFD